MRLPVASALFLSLAVPCLAAAAPPAEQYHILQRPALTQDTIVFGYAGDLWSVPRTGGRANRLTIGVGIETSPVVSPDGQTVAFSGEYDGNTDVFTIPIGGGIPKRVTYNPAADVPVAWTPDGKIVFRSNRSSHSRYTELFEVAPTGGFATRVPLPMAYQGSISPDGKTIAYSPIAPAFGFNYTSYVAWGNYHGGEAGTVNVTDLKTLETVTVPHEKVSDFSPVWLKGKVYFLSARKGPIGLFSYDPATKVVTEVFHNTGPDLHSLAAGPNGLVYDQLGEIYLMEPGGKPHLVDIDVTSDLPEVRPRIESVSSQVEGASISPTGVRVAFEAHGEVLTVPARRGPTRDLTNTPGVMERHPAWSPDGQSVAFFSDEPGANGQAGLYSLHVMSQTGEGAAKKFALAPEPSYYFDPKWSPDSKKIAFYDNRLRLWSLDVTNGKLTEVGPTNHFSGIQREYAWSPDSNWLAFTHEEDNHLHVLYLFNAANGQISPVTDKMADAESPAFDRNGKYLYFTISTNEGGVSFGLDMSTDLLRANRTVYAAVLAADGPSPLAPESDDEKTVAQARERARDMGDEPPAGAGARRAGAAPAEGNSEEGAQRPSLPVPPVTRPIHVDVAGIQGRLVALPLRGGNFVDLQTGRAGGFFFLERGEGGRGEGGGGGATLRHFSLESHEASTVMERVSGYEVSANGEKILIVQARPMAGNAEAEPGRGGAQNYSIINAPANAPAGGGGGAGRGAAGAGAAAASPGTPLNLSDMQVRVDPKAEWNQIFHEVWRVERAYFYDPNLHGVNSVAEEKRFEPYVASIASRTDLNYILQEMLSGFSVGHLRGNGGDIPEARRVPGGLLGADYEIKNNRYCIAKLYDGGEWNPAATGPLTQPGLNVHPGDCILTIGGKDITAAMDIQEPLEGTAGHAVTLHIGAADGSKARDIVVIPVRTEAQLRNFEWIDENIKKVDQLSGGKLAYIYLPDTGQGGFTNFNRYYFAQTEKQGAIIDERFNSGGQVADYIIEAMERQLLSYWSPRYGAIDRTPNAAIYGPKVMIINEFAGSGGDAMPYLFRRQKIGPLVGKRTWGGLVGIGSIPALMDGGTVTSPSFGQFSPEGTWDVENKGIEPDYVVEQDPKAAAEGHDPQLEKAVALAMEQLSKQPAPEPHRPAYPNYHK
ncbi:MAG TPA: PDZ domain-containing protein [Acidobacteriaceae bacterium]|jgi:tricorn protease